MCICIHAYGLYTCGLFKCLKSSVHVRLYTCLWTLHLWFIQVLKVVHTCAFVGLWTLHLLFVQVSEVVHGCAFVHRLMDFTLVVCSSA
jgi:hypothetical protein